MGILKNLALGDGASKRLIPRAEKFMREHVRTMFCSEAEANQFFLRGLARRYHECQGCPLASGRTRVVFGAGNCGADVLLVGEAPGETEDLRGLPFVGPTGILLRRLLVLAGFTSADLFITNTVACRPDRNRAPTAQEAHACRPRLEQIGETLRPRVIILVGGEAGKWAGADQVGKFRGLLPRDMWPKLPPGGNTRLRAVAYTYHPSYIMRQEGRGARKAAMLKVLANLKVAREELVKARDLDAEAVQVVQRLRARPESEYQRGG